MTKCFKLGQKSEVLMMCPHTRGREVLLKIATNNLVQSLLTLGHNEPSAFLPQNNQRQSINWVSTTRTSWHFAPSFIPKISSLTQQLKGILISIFSGEVKRILPILSRLSLECDSFDKLLYVTLSLCWLLSSLKL